MLTLDEVKQILRKLSLENEMESDENLSENALDEELSEEVSSIVYYNDRIECDATTTIIDKHIDIEMEYGEYYEIQEETPLFQYICTLCNLSCLDETKEEMILYQK